MYLTEVHKLTKASPDWERIDLLSSKSKDLYNKSLYKISQYFEVNQTYDTNKGKVYSRASLYQLLKEDTTFRCGENTKILKEVYQQVNEVYSSYISASREYHKIKKKFKAPPKKPKFKGTKSRNLVTVPFEALSFKRSGYIKVAGTNFLIKSTRPKSQVKEVRIIPCKEYYQVEVIYEKKEKKEKITGNMCGIDLGINNLMAVAANEPGIRPLLINGKPLKAMNQFFHKKTSNLKRGSKRFDILNHKRNNKVKDYMHKCTSLLIKWLEENNINRVVIGYNKGWKYKVNMGKRTNQLFAYIPFHILVSMITYKCSLRGIKVLTREESYTSKCSFLDMEPIRKSDSYCGKRKRRGLFQSKEGILMNADINGSLNILRKEAGDGIFIPDSGEAVEMGGNYSHYAVRPLSLTPHR